MASDHHHRHRRQEREVSVEIWKACAGTTVQIPAVHSTVCYFPQGHLEQSSSPSTELSLSSLVTSRPSILCRVVQVFNLADPDTDEVFAKIRLEPIIAGFTPEASGNTENGSNGKGNGVVSFAKVLTPSDANNGGGFSVPRFCADSIFPPLDFTADPPVQNIHITDVHGEVWEFRHIFRGTPRRHLLTTGWSKFVNSKKLIAGDSCVFIRDKDTGKLFVGIRRAIKSIEVKHLASHYVEAASVALAYGGFSRNGKGRVPPEVVVEAAERAASNLPFEVVYYPRAGLPDFVVAADKVEAATAVYWSSGMNVKMATELDDSLKMSWMSGTVADVVVPVDGLWCGSPWRMLQVAWEDAPVSQNMKSVSPWQVEFVPPTPVLPPTKKLRSSHNSGLLKDGKGDIPLPPLRSGLSSSYLSYNTSPAGMQGARQNPYLVSRLPRITYNGAYEIRTDLYLDNMPQNLGAVSTVLNVDTLPCDTPSPDSQDNVQNSDTDTSRQSSCKLPRKAGTTSFQLFGKTIDIEQPLTDDVTCSEYDDGTADVTRKSMSEILCG